MYKSRHHTKYSLAIHLVFVCKYRHKLLSRLGDIVKNLVAEACKIHGYELVTQEVDEDHIHILLKHNPQTSVTDIVRNLKSYTTYHIRRQHDDYISKYIWGSRRFWSRGYFVCSIGEGAIYDTIKEYIKNQG